MLFILVLKKWDQLYGDYLVNEETGEQEICDENVRTETTDETSSRLENKNIDDDNPFLALFEPLVSQNIANEYSNKSEGNDITWNKLWNDTWAKVCMDEYNKFLELRTQEIITEKTIQDVSKDLVEKVVIEEEENENVATENTVEEINLCRKPVGMAYWLKKVAEDHAEYHQNASNESASNENDKSNDNCQKSNTEAVQSQKENTSNGDKSFSSIDNDDGEEPPDEIPIIRSKRTHENEDHDEMIKLKLIEEDEEVCESNQTYQRLVSSKAGKAFADLGFTFQPGKHQRYPDTSSIRAGTYY